MTDAGFNQTADPPLCWCRCSHPPCSVCNTIAVKTYVPAQCSQVRRQYQIYFQITQTTKLSRLPNYQTSFHPSLHGKLVSSYQKILKTWSKCSFVGSFTDYRGRPGPTCPRWSSPRTWRGRGAVSGRAGRWGGSARRSTASRAGTQLQGLAFWIETHLEAVRSLGIHVAAVGRPGLSVDAEVTAKPCDV